MDVLLPHFRIAVIDLDNISIRNFIDRLVKKEPYII